MESALQTVLYVLFTLLGFTIGGIIFDGSGLESKEEIKPDYSIEVINGVSDTTFIYKRKYNYGKE